MILTTSIDIRKTKINQRKCTLVYNNIVLRLNMLYLEKYFRLCTLSRMKAYLKEWIFEKELDANHMSVANG